MLARAARDILPGMTVNLGIGLPTQVMAHVAPDCPVCLHSENGIAGVGGLTAPGREDRNLIDAGGGYILCAAGGSFFDSAVSFALVRGGRLDLTLLGAFEIAANGDLANWIIPGKFAAGVGGAIELAQKARRVGVLTTHTDKHGNPKILERCTLPLTARGCVDRIYTDMAVCDVRPDGLHLVELAEGVELAELRFATGAPLIVADGPIPRF
ncbi:CoA-transferase [Hoeflea olei]|uniref:CoA-transferase n=2 Tax=Hoeflea olei TaxID=1480615 RepID=A0A1C1YWV1_9HYPH|nr:CoA-transferase [Hoeflea olei]